MSDQHAKRSPSGVYKWALCAGSLAAEDGLPDVESEFALEGRAAHALAERCLIEDLTPEFFAKKSIGDVLVDQEMVDAIRDYLALVYEQATGCAEMLVEQRVAFDAYVPEGFGTVDCVILFDNGLVVIIDLKYGKGVKVDEFLQHRVYALGVLQDFGWMYDIEKFRLIVSQPRLNHVGIEEITVEELLQWHEDFIVPAIEAGDDPDAPRTPGEKQCQFCKAKPTCPALAETAREMMSVGFDDLEHQGPPPAPALTAEQIGQAMAQFKVIRNWMTAVEEHALHQMKLGNEIPGFKLVEGRSNRKWADEEAAEKYLKRKVGAKETFNKSLISPTAAEKLVGKKEPRLQQLITKAPGAPTMAPENDTRPALAIDLSEGFENLEGE